MPYKVNVAPYEIEDETVNIMTMDALGTMADGLERGFHLCGAGPSQLVAGERCTGSVCGIKYHDCGTRREVGSFHTHPNAPTLPSAGDCLNIMYKALVSTEKRNLGCRTGNIAVVRDGKRSVEPGIQFDYLNAASHDQAKMLGLYAKLSEDFKNAYSVYEEWEKTGKQPAYTDPRWRVMERIAEEVKRYFKTGLTPLADFHDTYLKVLERRVEEKRRKLREQPPTAVIRLTKKGRPYAPSPWTRTSA